MPSNQMLASSTSRRNLRRIIQNASSQAACTLRRNIVCLLNHRQPGLIFLQSRVEIASLQKVTTKSDHSVREVVA